MYFLPSRLKLSIGKVRDGYKCTISVYDYITTAGALLANACLLLPNGESRHV